MNKIEGTIVEAGRLESGAPATCGIVVWTTEKQKAEMERWEYNGLVVVERKADHDAREAELAETTGKLQVVRASWRALIESSAAREAEVERLRDANLQRVAEGMSRWCAPQSPHLDAIADALQHAKRKHPFFAHYPMEKWLPRQTSVALAEARANLADMIAMNSVTGSGVLECEIAEARDDYAHGDFAACLAELAQCGAVVVRMMEAVQELIDKEEAK